MENASLYPAENSAPKNESQPPTGETSILESTLLEEADMSGYQKNLKRGRIWLYIIAGMQAAMGVFEFISYNTESDIFRWSVFGIDAGIGLIFLACALWSFKKPTAAFLAALICYIAVSVTMMYLNSANITAGIIVKIFVVIALVRAYKDARHIEEMKQLFVE